jgi:hypothetical protein
MPNLSAKSLRPSVRDVRVLFRSSSDSRVRPLGECQSRPLMPSKMEDCDFPASSAVAVLTLEPPAACSLQPAAGIVAERVRANANAATPG